MRTRTSGGCGCEHQNTQNALNEVNLGTHALRVSGNRGFGLDELLELIDG